MFDFFNRLKRPETRADATPKKGYAGLLTESGGNVHPDKPEAVIRIAFDRAFQRPALFAEPRTTAAMDGKDAPVNATDASDTGIMENKVQQSLTGNPQQMAWFSQASFIGYQACALLSQHWLIEKACSQPVVDAARNGYDITINDGESGLDDVERLRAASQKLKVAESLVEFGTKARVFGVRIAMCDFGLRGADLEAPFNIDGVTAGSYKGIKQFDPYWITPELTQDSIDPLSLDFYEPTYWRVGSQRIHKSHLVVVRNGHVPDILKPTYFYGGIPIPQLIRDRVYSSEQTANEAPKLAMSKRLNVLKCDMEAAMLNQSALVEKLELFGQIRDNHGIKLVGHDDDVSQIDTSLADLDEVVMTQYQLVAAASRVPATKLLGTTPKGFNSAGDYEQSSYHEELESIQETFFTPLLNRHFDVLCRSERISAEVKVEWKPCDSPTSKELAELLKNRADMDVAYLNAGVLLPEQIHERLVSDPLSGYAALEGEHYEEIDPNPSEGATGGQGSPEGAGGSSTAPTGASGTALREEPATADPATPTGNAQGG